MGNRASPKILKKLIIEYDIHSVFSPRVEAMEMLKIVQEYFNCDARLKQVHHKKIPHK